LTGPDISVKNGDEKALLDAISNLKTRNYTMSGDRTAVGLSSIPASPRFVAEVTKLEFPNGAMVKAVNTHIDVTDEFNKQDRITGKSDQAPLSLFADEKPENTIDLLRGFSSVGNSDVAIATNEETTIHVNMSVKAVSHRAVVDFVETNKNLFSDEQYQTISQHESYSNESQAPTLLLGIMGLKLGGSFEYFSMGNKMEISPFDADGFEFIEVLSDLINKDLTLSGDCTAVGLFAVATEPFVYVDVLRITLPSGVSFRVIDTNPIVDDEEKKGMNRVTVKDGQPPLSLK
jgi:hypothetical protein